MCLDAQNRILAPKIDFKADASQVAVGVFAVALIHFILEKFVFKVRSARLRKWHFYSYHHSLWPIYALTLRNPRPRSAES